MILALAPALALQRPIQKQQAVDGAFKVIVLPVPNLEQFERDWKVTTEGAHITSNDRLIRNKPTFIVVLFGGCERNTEGKCRIEVRPELRTPDGQFYDGMDGTKPPPAADVPVSRPDSFFLAPQVVGMEIEPGEALGPYRLKVTVSDLIAKRTAVTEQTLTAVEAE